MLQNKTFSPSLKIAVGSVMISFSAVFVKLTTTEPTIDGFYRMLFGGIGLAIIMLFKKHPLSKSPRAWLLATTAGVLFSIDLVFWHRSIQHLGPGLATIIVNLQVFILAVIGFIFYGDKITWKYALAIPFATIGLYFLVGTGWHLHSENYQIGIFQSIIAMFCYALYIVILRASQKISNPMGPIPNLTVICFTSSLLLGIIAILSGEHFAAATPIDWLWLTLYGIFGQIFGWLLITQGLPYISITRAGFLLLLQPALSFFWDVLFFNRVTLADEVFGALLTLFAIFLSNTSRESKGIIPKKGANSPPPPVSSLGRSR